MCHKEKMQNYNYIVTTDFILTSYIKFKHLWGESFFPASGGVEGVSLLCQDSAKSLWTVIYSELKCQNAAKYSGKKLQLWSFET